MNCSRSWRVRKLETVKPCPGRRHGGLLHTVSGVAVGVDRGACARSGSLALNVSSSVTSSVTVARRTPYASDYLGMGTADPFPPRGSGRVTTDGFWGIGGVTTASPGLRGQYPEPVSGHGRDYPRTTASSWRCGDTPGTPARDLARSGEPWKPGWDSGSVRDVLRCGWLSRYGRGRCVVRLTMESFT